MTKRRLTVASLSLLILATVTAVTLGFGLLNPSNSAEAQSPIRDNSNNGIRNGDGPGGDSNHDLTRLEHAIKVLAQDPSPEAAQEAIQHGMDLLIGGMRPLPTKGDETLEMTTQKHNEFLAMEGAFAETLDNFIRRGRSAEEKGLATNARQLIAETNDIAREIAVITSQCGAGDFILAAETDNFFNPCSQLQPLLNETTGLEDEPVFSPDDTVFGEVDSTFKPIDPLTRSYSVNLRADLIPPRWSRDIPEDVRVTEPLAPGECAVVFKEFRGLLLQLHIEGITTVKDPGNASGLSGVTSEPIWVLRWMPAQYGKQWSMCNTGTDEAPTVTTTVTRQVVEDEGLVYFWRFYD